MRKLTIIAYKTSKFIISKISLYQVKCNRNSLNISPTYEVMNMQKDLKKKI